MNDKWGLTVRGICEIDGEILLLKIRSKSKHDSHKWEIPGGKVKKGEFFDEALRREYLEETGLEIFIENLFDAIQRDYTACKSGEEVKSIQLIMKVNAKSKNVKISTEHEDYKWFSKEEINELYNQDLLSDASKIVFKK